MSKKLIAAVVLALLGVSAVGLAVAQGSALITRATTLAMPAERPETPEVVAEKEQPTDFHADYRTEKRYCRSMQGTSRKSCLADAKVAYEKARSQAHRGYAAASTRSGTQRLTAAGESGPTRTASGPQASMN